MPLNIRDLEGSESKKVGPPVHQPRTEMSSRTKSIFTVIVIIVVLIALFVMYKTGILAPKNRSQPQTVFNQQLDSTALDAQSTNIELAVPNGSMNENKHQAITNSMGNGNYTICVGSYPVMAIANEEAGLWTEAGYPGFVNQVSLKDRRTFRVCLGHYTGISEARRQAEKLKDGFESGYWIDMMK